MAIAGNMALLAGAKGRLGKSRFAGAASTPAAVSLHRTVPSPAPLLRLHRLTRSAAARCSLAVVRVARGNSSCQGDSMLTEDGDTTQTPQRRNAFRDAKRKLFVALLLGLSIWAGISAVKWSWAILF